MSDVLYIAPYRSASGWGEASRQLAMAFSRSKHNVDLRPIYMCNSRYNSPLNEELLKMENSRIGKYDVVVQYVLPHLFELNRYAGKNVGIFMVETNNLKDTGWLDKCHIMDELWVFTNHLKAQLIKQGVKTPIKVIPTPVDVDKFKLSYSPIITPEFSEVFNFYFVGEYTQRKNLSAALVAFHLEFGTEEPVNFVIKTNKGGMSAADTNHAVVADINQLKQSLRIYNNVNRYKQEVVITEYLDDNGMGGLHSSCHCFVMPSRGEAWCLPAVDAMGFGNTPIATKHTGMDEFVNGLTGWSVNSHKAPVLCTDAPMSNIYTARETWQNIDILHLRQCMREAYEDKEMREQKRAYGQNFITKFSYDAVGELLNESC